MGKLRRRARTVGPFCYEVSLPGEVPIDGTEATLDEGVLALRIPRAERTCLGELTSNRRRIRGGRPSLASGRSA
jgi:HSP20 family molecular chaperone IbpA